MRRCGEVSIGSFAAAAAVGGTVVVIDVIRAFTTMALALDRGAAAVVLAATPERALALRDAGRGAYCLGERGGLMPPGFDFGNSPAEIAPVDFGGAVLIQTTSNGTRGVIAAAEAGAGRIYAGALVAAEATVQALAAADDGSPVSLVAMGSGDRERSEEDELCALYLRARLEGQRPDKRAFASLLKSLLGEPGRSERHFASLSADDIAHCLALDSLPFALRVRKEGELLVARPERASA